MGKMIMRSITRSDQAREAAHQGFSTWVLHVKKHEPPRRYLVATTSLPILVRPRLIGPPLGGLWRVTPGSQIRSNRPLRMAGIPYHQIGKHRTSASAAPKRSTYLTTPARVAPTA